MVELHELKPPKGSKKERKRVGRGTSSGYGKTCGRGDNGQNSRSGGSVRPGFEGGQTPLYLKFPKHGFNNRFSKEIVIVNVDELNRFEAESVITPKVLMEEGLIEAEKDGVKILGRGELEKDLTVKAHQFSQSAAEKIENAGGKAEVI